jgi:hypothetical protein
MFFGHPGKRNTIGVVDLRYHFADDGVRPARNFSRVLIRQATGAKLPGCVADFKTVLACVQKSAMNPLAY